MRMMIAWFIIGVVVGLCGCGGGGGSGQMKRENGTMKMHVVWPSRVDHTDAPYIARATQSLVVSIDDGHGYRQTQTVERPADNSPSSVMFSSVPAGAIMVAIQAMPHANGTGIALTSATVVATILNRQMTVVSTDLSSTITKVTLDHAPSYVHASETAQLIATARNAEEAVVPVPAQPNRFRWSSSASAVAEVNQYGVLTAHTAGTTTVSAMERETGITGTIDVIVEPANGMLVINVVSGDVSVTMEPATVTIVTEGIAFFTARVEGVPNQAVFWSVQEANGGTITKDGLYTAPSTPGTYHVVAASIADETKTAMATVWVNQSRIVFSKCDGAQVANYDLFAINPDGTNMVQLTTHYNVDAYPSMASDGTKIVWSTKRDGRFSVFSMSSIGTNLLRLTDGAFYNYQPCLSPDGTKIAFYSDRAFNHDIYVMNADGSNQVAVTHEPGYEYYPTFSADGTRIVYTTDQTGNAEIFSIKLDGTDAVNLTNHPANDGYPTCSPDGKYIVFESYRSGNSDLFIMDIDGSNVRQLTNDEYYDTEPSFSPNGKQIVFSSNRTADGNDELFIMNVDGTNLRQLTDVPVGFCLMPSWWL